MGRRKCYLLPSRPAVRPRDGAVPEDPRLAENLYVYGENDPISYLDPTGEFATKSELNEAESQAGRLAQHMHHSIPRQIQRFLREAQNRLLAILVSVGVWAARTGCRSRPTTTSTRSIGDGAEASTTTLLSRRWRR